MNENPVCGIHSSERVWVCITCADGVVDAREAEIAALKVSNAKMKALLLELAMFMECDKCDTAAVDYLGTCLVCGFNLFSDASETPTGERK